MGARDRRASPPGSLVLYLYLCSIVFRYQSSTISSSTKFSRRIYTITINRQDILPQQVEWVPTLRTTKKGTVAEAIAHHTPRVGTTKYFGLFNNFDSFGIIKYIRHHWLWFFARGTSKYGYLIVILKNEVCSALSTVMATRARDAHPWPRARFAYACMLACMHGHARDAHAWPLSRPRVLKSKFI
eukprot:SAG31_NODE_305_length_18002_cov_7.242808_10_plen_185_part_00